MSSFNDATFRSQQMLAPYQMQGAMNKTAGIASIGQGMASGADMIQRGVESAARIAAFQQEQQLNQYKLQQMRLLDEAGMSRMQVESARMANEAQALGLEEARRKLDAMRTQQSAFEAEARQTLFEAETLTGSRYDEAQQKMVPLDEGELEKRQERMQSFYGAKRARYSSTTDPLMRDARTMDLMIRSAREALDNAFIPEERDAAQSRLLALEKRRNSLEQPWLGDVEVSDGEPQAKSWGRNPQPAQVRPDVSAYAEQSYNDDRWQADPFWSKLNTDEPTRIALSQGIGIYADALMQRLGKRGRNVDPARVYSYAFQVAKERPDQMALLLAFSGDDNEVIGMKLRALFPNISDDDVKEAISTMEREASDLLSEDEQ